MSAQPYRPAVIELVQTTGPRHAVPGDTTQHWHARIRAAGNRQVTWWSEDYTRRARALRAVELLPGVRYIGDIPASAGGGTEVVFYQGGLIGLMLRDVDER